MRPLRTGVPRRCSLFESETVAGFKAIKSIASRKLDMLDEATRLADLRSPPGKPLEALRGDRRRPHSIRIND